MFDASVIFKSFMSEATNEGRIIDNMKKKLFEFSEKWQDDSSKWTVHGTAH